VTSTIQLPRRLWWRIFLRSRKHFGAPGDPYGRRPSVAAVEATYRDLMTDPPSVAGTQPMLAWHLRESIAPILALYLVVLQESGDRAYARAAAERAMVAQMAPVLAVYGAADRIGVPFRLVRLSTRWLLPRVFPAPGFAVTWRSDSADELAFDIHGCFYLRALTHYGAPELTGVFCLGDEILFRKLPHSIRFARTGTLALGSSHCDFSFRPDAQEGAQ
jgi:hypothetical protein